MSNTEGVPLPSFPRRLIFETLKRTTGRDYEPYLSAPFEDALRHRLQIGDIDDLDNYLRRLDTDPDEALQLERRALVGVTRFFRDPQAFEALGAHIHRLLRRRSTRHPLRIWVPACATGQEAYSLAILLNETGARQPDVPDVRLVGTDINIRAIEFARQSRFQPRQMRSFGHRRCQSFFSECDGAFEPVNSLRKSVWFAVHDLMDPPPFDDVDIISCRNLLIYLRPQFQQRLLRTFAQLLRPRGLLFLGASETIPTECDNFTRIDSTHRIFRPQSRSPD